MILTNVPLVGSERVYCMWGHILYVSRWACRWAIPIALVLGRFVRFNDKIQTAANSFCVFPVAADPILS